MRAALAILILCLWTGTSWAAAMRIVSLNLCADQLLVLLAEREQIAAVSHLSRDPALSHVAEQAARLPVTRGGAEEVLTLRPDLILAGEYGAQPAIRLLKRLGGVPVVRIGLAESFTDIRRHIVAVAEAVGHPGRGRAMLAEMDTILAAVPPPERRPTALLYQPNGFTAGAGTLADAVLSAAGFANLGASSGLHGYGFLPLETVVANPPDLLIRAHYDARRPSEGERLLRHPALASSATMVASLDGPLFGCGGPFTATAVARLAEIRAGLPH